MTNSTQTQLSQAELMGQFRLTIIGGLLASPPDKGNLTKQLSQLAQKSWLHPLSGLTVNYSLPTLERWYYKAKNASNNPVKVLSTPIRTDKGQFNSISQAVRDAFGKTI